MKKTLLLLSVLTSVLSTILAQSKMNFSLVKKIQENKNNRSQTMDVFIQGDVNTIKALVSANGGTFKYSAGNIAVVNLPLGQIGNIVTNKAVQRIEAYSQHIRPMNDTMLKNNNIIPVHTGQAPLTQAYDGTGVVVGFIDTGIDFSHPDFKNSNGKSRIKFIWDQTLADSANTPLPYNYGQEFTNSDIDNGLASAHTDKEYHGTHVAGVGVGNGLANSSYKGAAPNAEIIMVSLGNSSTVFSDGVDYIYSKAQAMNKPCVINISFGDYYGSHDGQDLQAQLIKNMINQRSGQALVAAAGNAGSIAFHLGYNVTTDTNFTFFSNTSNSVYMQLWADTINFKNIHFTIGADQMTPAHLFRGKLPFTDISTHLGIFKEDTLFKNGKQIGRIQSYGDVVGGSYSMEYNIIPDSTTYDWRLITTGSGKFDLWSFDLDASNLPSLATMPDSIFYKSPDKNQTICSSFQCLDNVITVANYTNRRSYIDYSNNLYVDYANVPGRRHITSSIGPTRDGRIKPDIAGPGDMTMAAVVLAGVPTIISNNLPDPPHELDLGGYHIRSGGTSNAAPGIAGIAALYLQKNPTATAMDVKQAIITCATQDQFTGSNLPNNQWGYGKANAFNALTGCLPTNVNTIKNINSLIIYPNPSSAGTILNIEVSSIRPIDKTVMKIYNTLGELVKTISLNNSSIQLNNDLLPGIYFCNLVLNGHSVSTKKLVIL